MVQDGSHGRRPPLPAAVGRWDAIGVEVGCDLGEALAGGLRESDPLDDLSWDGLLFCPAAPPAVPLFWSPAGVRAMTCSSSSTGMSFVPQGISIVLRQANRRRKVERLMPSASAAWVRV